MKSLKERHYFLLTLAMMACSMAVAANFPELASSTAPMANTSLSSLAVENNRTSHYALTTITQASFAKLSLSAQETLTARWGLTPREYGHYLQLMEETPDGLYYRDQHLDPSWILGINAKTEEERRQYVTLAVRHERERMAKLLVFQQAFDRIQRELFPNDQPIQFTPKESHADLGIPVTCR